MSGHHTGSCLCGAVRFRIEGEFERFYLCHCSHCRKDTGSAHAAGQFLAVPAGSLDSDVRRRPDAHIFVASRASWDKALEDIPAHETFPA